MNKTRDDIPVGADDKQIDALIVDDDKSMVRIIQGKFIQSGTVDAEPLREVLSSWLQIKDHARLQNALEEDYEVSFELITTGMLTEAAQHDFLPIGTDQNPFAHSSIPAVTRQPAQIVIREIASKPDRPRYGKPLRFPR